MLIEGPRAAVVVVMTREATYEVCNVWETR